MYTYEECKQHGKPILCATNLYRDLQGINYFAATKFRDQDIDCLENNIQYKLKNTITSLAKNSRSRIKVNLQHCETVKHNYNIQYAPLIHNS